MPETDLDAIFERHEASLRRYAPPLVDRERELHGEREWVDEAAA
jgi:hypothetical protein